MEDDRMRFAALGAAIVLLLLSGCSSRGDDQPGTVTADESRQLNDAAAMLDANSIDANAVATNDQDTQ